MDKSMANRDRETCDYYVTVITTGVFVLWAIGVLILAFSGVR